MKKINNLIFRRLPLLGLLILLSGGIEAAELQEDQVMEKYTLMDNHGKENKMNEDTEVVLLSFEMEKSKEIHQWLSEKDPDYLGKHKTEYIADITKMPAIITKLFAGPKMAKYPFQILLANDKTFAEKFPKKEGKITVLVLDKNRKVTHILFFKDMNEVNGLISGAKSES